MGLGMDTENDTEDPAKKDTLQNVVIAMAIESWRFARLFDRMASKVDAGEQNRYRGQYRWFIKKIEEALEETGLKLVNIEGHPFDPGLAATPLNIEEFDTDDSLFVDQMLEPIIMGGDGVVKTGTVLLRKVEK